MAKQKSGELIVGLDIGTTKICAIVGELTENGIDIIGIGTHPSKGLRKGVVVNIEATVASIRRAVEEAELMAGCEIAHVYTGIAGGHIKGFNSQGIVAVKDKEVREADIARVIDAAKAVAIPLDREVIHVLPQEYIIDDQGGIREPLGMSGVRLEAMVDIGGGTTDIVIFSGGSIVHTAVIALGGNNLTSDIAIGLRTPAHEAERIKQKYGCALVSMVDKEDTIEVPSVGGRQPRVLGRPILCEILEPRVEEIFQLVQREIQRCGYEELLASGVVITGGSTLLAGMPELAEEVLGLPVRRGMPRGIGGLVDVVKSPMYATGVGLVVYGAKHQDRRMFRIREDNVYKKVKGRMREWLEEIF